jgi:hypothetical protein
MSILTILLGLAQTVMGFVSCLRSPVGTLKIIKVPRISSLNRPYSDTTKLILWGRNLFRTSPLHCRRREDANEMCGGLFCVSSVFGLCSVERRDDWWLLNLKSVGRIRVLPQHWTGETDRSLRKKCKDCWFPDPEYPNTSLERYRYTNLLWVVTWDQFSAFKFAPPTLWIMSEISFRRIWLPYSYRSATFMQACRRSNAHRVLVKAAFGKTIALKKRLVLRKCVVSLGCGWNWLTMLPSIGLRN